MKRTAHAHENVKNELSMYENMDLKKKDEENRSTRSRDIGKTVICHG